MRNRAALVSLIFVLVLWADLHAADVMTVYDLLAPNSHKFAIRYDVSATEPGTRLYYNIVLDLQANFPFANLSKDNRSLYVPRYRSESDIWLLTLDEDANP